MPLLAVLGLAGIRWALHLGKIALAWACSALFIIGVTFFGVLGMFPNLIPSSLNPAWSVSLMHSASSPLTLKIMLGVVIVFVPIVLIYQAWVYFTFTHKVTEEALADEHAY